MKMQTKKTSLLLCLALLVIAAGCGKKTDTGGTVGTSGTTVRVTDVSLGRAIGSDKAITDGTASTATVRARWTFEDGQTVNESSRTIAPAGRERTEFHIAKPGGWPAGKYKLEVFLNDQSAETKTFEVK